MKKLFVIGLISILCFTFVGCGTKNKDEKPKDDTKTQEDSSKPTKFMNDNKSYFIKIDGKKFYAGDDISKLSSVGYDLKERDKEQSLPANKYMIGAGYMVNSSGKQIFNVTPYNTTDSSITVAKAKIGGISIDSFAARYDEKINKFEIYGGIKIGSTEAEVKEIFGEPTSTIEGKSDDSLTYIYDSDEVYRNYKIRLDKDRVVTSIEWKNLVFNK